MFSLKQNNTKSQAKACDLEMIKKGLGKLPANLLHFLTKNKLQVIFVDKKIDKDYCISELDNFKIRVFKTVSQESILHELGHFALVYLIFYSYLDTKIGALLEKFCQETDELGGISSLADSYVKELYGIKLRKQGKHLIYNYDIKYHENFAEAFTFYCTKDARKFPPSFLELMKCLYTPTT